MSSEWWFLIGFFSGAIIVLVVGIIAVHLGIKAGVEAAFRDIKDKHHE